ncbi:sterol desaturase family protein [Henriciella marina]|uniref:sterol desaturase family protein n=1 Tax=Henriciella marina TaxID=453851 RepID=UPI0003719FB1|nr:sterol desaturase family protein [Henriciella marina]
MPEFPSPTTLAAPAFVLAVIWEWWAVKSGRAGGRYETKDAVASMAMGVGNLVVNTLTGAITLWMMMLVWPFRLMEIPVTWWSFILLFVAYDFTYYWKHRLAHRVRWFWMEHVTHHSSTHYNLTTALRQPWFGPFTGLILLGLPLVLIGFHPLFIFFAGGLNLLYQFWIHTESIGRMPGWFEAVMNTPSHHRVHHATNPRYLDANYAGVFIVWDKMFGSFVEEREDEPPTYGIVKPLGSYNPVTIAFHEAGGLVADCRRDGLKPLRWLGRAINPPGWSPDGNHNRSEDIRAAWAAAQAGAAAPGEDMPRRQPDLPSAAE